MNAAFVNAAPLTARAPARSPTMSRTVAPVMTVRKTSNRAARLAASVPASLLTALPAMATEGTGEGLGIDTPLLFIPIVLIPAVFFVFFLQFGRSQSNEDFTGEIDSRRN